MLCKLKINAQSNRTNMAVEFMESISSIATANSGATPTHASATIEVLDNTTAGGWTQGTAANTAATVPHTTLITDSGKSSKPYTFISFVKCNTNYLDTHYGFLESDTYPDYDLQTSGDQFFYPHDIGYNSSMTGASGADNITESLFAMDSNRKLEFYVLCTQECIHIQHSSTDRYYSGAWFHWGLRTNQSWEDLFNDNPYWVALWDHGYQFQNAMPNGYWTKMRTLNPADGTFSNPVVVSRFMDVRPVQETSSQFKWTHKLTGYQFTGSTNTVGRDFNGDSATIYQSNVTGIPQTSNSTTTGETYYARVADAQWDTATTTQIVAVHGTPSAWNDSYALCVPIHNLMQEGNSFQNGLTVDTNTFSIIPAASQMPIKMINGLNLGGVMKNVLQGAKFPNSNYWENYGTNGATVTIDGVDYIMTGFLTNDDLDPPRFSGNLYLKKT